MTFAPTVPSRVTPGDSTYGVRIEQHRELRRIWGKPLLDPWPELQAEAQRWAEANYAAMKQRLPSLPTRNEYGEGWVDCFRKGQVAAALLAVYFGHGVQPDWRVTGRPDPGYDLALPTSPVITLDVKLRQDWLCLQDREIKLHCRATYYALVNRTDDGQFIFCGVIKPIDFRRPVRFAAWIGGPVEAVTLDALQKPSHFHPFEM